MPLTWYSYVQGRLSSINGGLKSRSKLPHRLWGALCEFPTACLVPQTEGRLLRAEKAAPNTFFFRFHS